VYQRLVVIFRTTINSCVVEINIAKNCPIQVSILKVGNIIVCSINMCTILGL